MTNFCVFIINFAYFFQNKLLLPESDALLMYLYSQSLYHFQHQYRQFQSLQYFYLMRKFPCV